MSPAVPLPLLLIGLFLLPAPASACHWTDVTVMNGTWCCGANSDGFNRDQGDNTLPPLSLTTAPPQDLFNSSSVGPPISSSVPESSTEMPAPPVTGSPLPPKKNPDGRPQPPVGDCVCGEYGHAGSVSQTNRPWLAQLTITNDDGVIRECSGSLLNRRWLITAARCICGFLVDCSQNFEFIQGSEPLNNKGDSIAMKIGTYEDKMKPVHRAIRIDIHPNYKQGVDDYVSNIDVALIKTQLPVFGEKAPGNPPINHVQPICLPPEHSSDVETHDPEPFEDMDCFVQKDVAVPYPFTGNSNSARKEYLVCHPGAHTEEETTNIMGRNTYVSSAGGINTRKRLCTTNSYGPYQHVHEPCTSECFKSHTNPSLSHSTCVRFQRNGYWNASLLQFQHGVGEKNDFGEFNEDSHDLAWVKIETLDNDTVTCYMPVLDTEHPFQDGWCLVCEDEKDCVHDNDDNWGWCSERCNNTKTGFEEFIVDAFAYDDCSPGVRTETEFCTALPIVSAFGQIWREVDTENFEYIKNQLTTFRSLTEEMKSKTVGGDTHSQVGAEPCKGDAGASVWKKHGIRGRIDSNLHFTAFLIGVLSRQEQDCLNTYSKPEYYTVNTRIQGILDWIYNGMNDEDGKCYHQFTA